MNELDLLKQKAQKFVDERDWDKYHTLKNLAMAISVESAELLEIFQWVKDTDVDEVLKSKRTEIEHEIADVFLTVLSFCNKADIDLIEAFSKKMLINEQKYPIDKSKGSSKKYSEL